MGRGYTVLPANVKPHVIAAMFNMETPVDGTEQGQTLVRVKVIVDRRVILRVSFGATHGYPPNFQESLGVDGFLGIRR